MQGRTLRRMSDISWAVVAGEGEPQAARWSPSPTSTERSFGMINNDEKAMTKLLPARLLHSSPTLPLQPSIPLATHTHLEKFLSACLTLTGLP